MVLVSTHEGPGSQSRFEPPLPVPEVDVAGFVLAAVDQHLAVLEGVRRQLAMPRAIEPGACWHAAALSVSEARRYADEVARALRLVS